MPDVLPFPFAGDAPVRALPPVSGPAEHDPEHAIDVLRLDVADTACGFALIGSRGGLYGWVTPWRWTDQGRALAAVLAAAPQTTRVLRGLLNPTTPLAERAQLSAEGLTLLDGIERAGG